VLTGSSFALQLWHPGRALPTHVGLKCGDEIVELAKTNLRDLRPE
jgi:hypothetical protein